MSKSIYISERLYLDRLRVLAIILVIIGHATRMFTVNGVYYGTLTSIRFFEHITIIIYSFHMPLFMMLSGYVYGICTCKGGYYNTLVPFFWKKSRRLLMPYYFWGLFYVAPVMVLLSITPMTYPYYVTSGILLGVDSRHLWFLFALFGIFALVQPARLLLNRVYFIQQYKPVALLLGLVIGLLLAAIPKPSYFCMDSICDYLIYFLIGSVLNICRKVNWGGYVMVACFIILVLMLRAIGVIALLSACATCMLPIDKCPGFNAIKKYGMGLYILHPMLLYIVFYFYETRYNPYIYTIIALVVVSFISYFGCLAIKSSHLSMLLGEK